LGEDIFWVGDTKKREWRERGRESGIDAAKGKREFGVV
jgi:hypothetical protein